MVHVCVAYKLHQTTFLWVPSLGRSRRNADKIFLFFLIYIRLIISFYTLVR